MSTTGNQEQKECRVITSVSVAPPCFRRWLEAGNDQIPPPDVCVVTSAGQRFPAHSTVLASASPVLESIVLNGAARGGAARGGRRRGGSSTETETKDIPILGVPCDAVRAFLCLLYAAGARRVASSYLSKSAETMVGEHGLQLLALSHAYGVAWLKRACERAVWSRLSAETVVDVLVLARRCDAPRLHLRCMQLLAKDFKSVEQTEAWRFLLDNDPWLELDILQYLQEAHLRRRRQGRRKAERRVYLELQQAMDCLRHICKERCAEVGPFAGAEEGAGCCPNDATCSGLRRLILHFAACDREKRRGCTLCKRLWQLLRLHASICNELDDTSCKVPLCRQFKQRSEDEEDGGDDKWGLLVKKVNSARVMSYLTKEQSQLRQQSAHPGVVH